MQSFPVNRTDVIGMASMWGLFIIYFAFVGIALLTSGIQVYLYEICGFANGSSTLGNDKAGVADVTILRRRALHHNATEGDMLRYLIKAVDDIPKREIHAVHASHAAVVAGSTSNNAAGETMPAGYLTLI